MNKLEAILALIRDAEKDRISKTALQRVRRACLALGLSPDDTLHIESVLEYRYSGELRAILKP